MQNKGDFRGIFTGLDLKINGIRSGKKIYALFFHLEKSVSDISVVVDWQSPF